MLEDYDPHRPNDYEQYKEERRELREKQKRQRDWEKKQAYGRHSKSRSRSRSRSPSPEGKIKHLTKGEKMIDDWVQLLDIKICAHIINPLHHLQLSLLQQA